MPNSPLILVIDNYDSFTYNLVHYLQTLGCRVTVYFNDAIECDEIAAICPDGLLISPGPGRPTEAGITLAVIQAFATRLPILGVCLGHQALAQAFGGHIIQAPDIMHGKTSWIQHKACGLFSGLPSPFQAVRYHSLLVDAGTLPPVLKQTAWTDQGDIMAIQHRQYPLFGVQFHPESIGSEQGYQLLQNFILCAIRHCHSWR